MGLDSQVWSVMLILSILSIGLLGYKLADNKKCIPFTFNLKTASFHSDSIYYVGENVTFSSSNPGQSISWDFGDNSDKIEGSYVPHKYTVPGTYRIIASSGTDCDETRIIKIVHAPQSSYIREGEKIIGPSLITNAVEAEFNCAVLADSYTWSIKSYPSIKPIGSGGRIKFRFPNAGNYTIQVVLDNDRVRSYTKEISVDDVLTRKSIIPEKLPNLIPVDPTPDTKTQPEKLPEIKVIEEEDTKPRYVAINNETFITLLQSVQKGQMDISEFNRFFCQGIIPQVRENGKKKAFSVLYQELGSNKYKKATIKSLQLKRDSDGCIFIIEIDIKVPWIRL